MRNYCKNCIHYLQLDGFCSFCNDKIKDFYETVPEFGSDIYEDIQESDKPF